MFSVTLGTVEKEKCLLHDVRSNVLTQWGGDICFTAWALECSYTVGGISASRRGRPAQELGAAAVALFDARGDEALGERATVRVLAEARELAGRRADGNRHDVESWEEQRRRHVEVAAAFDQRADQAFDPIQMIRPVTLEDVPNEDVERGKRIFGVARRAIRAGVQQELERFHVP